METVKSEIQLACEIIGMLDGVPIESAQYALARAQQLLLRTQVARADSYCWRRWTPTIREPSPGY